MFFLRSRSESNLHILLESHKSGRVVPIQTRLILEINRIEKL